MESELEIEQILLERELFHRGDLRFLHHEGQAKINRKFEESPHQVQVVLCSRGYGKTYWGASLACSVAFKKKSSIKIGTEFYTDLENLILPNFEEVLKDCPERIRPVWKASKGKWIFPNGSEISLIGLDRKPNGLRGTHKVDLILLEEAGFISKLEQIYSSVIVPTTMHRPDCKIVLLTTPPESLDHYFWTFYDRAFVEGSLSTYTIDENPMLAPEQIRKIEKDMGGRETTAFKREMLCQRVAEATRMLAPEFSRDRHVIDRERPPYFNHLLKTLSLDTGVRHNTVQLYSYYDFPRARLVIEDELVLKGNEVLSSSIYQRTEETERSLGYDRPSRWADNNNLILLNDLNALGFKDESGRHWSPTAKDSVEAGVNMVRGWLSSGRLEILPKCRFLIGTLETALWNKQRTDFAESEVYGHADALAALIYLIRNVNVATNPIPTAWNADMDNTLILNPGRQTGSAQVLSEAFGLKRKPK